MGGLFPFEFGDLGVLGLVYLTLLGAGFSLAVTADGWRARFAWQAAAVTFALAVLRWGAGDGDRGAWDGFVGPGIVSPILVWLAVRAGDVRDRIPALARNVVLLVLIGMTRDVYLIMVLLALVAFVETDGRWHALLARRIGPGLRGAHVFALVFLLYCTFVQPHGIGFVGGLFHLFAAGFLYALLAQGEQMAAYVVRRLRSAPIVMAIILVLSFVMMRTAPGGPYTSEKSGDPEMEALREERMGLNDPWYEQFANYMVRVAWSGDLGVSFKQKGRPVNEIIADHIVPSAQLALVSITLAVLIGMVAGIISGIRQNSIFDYASMSVAMIGLALPTFVVGPFLVLLFAMKYQFFRVSGWDDIPSRDMVLPAITLALPFAARIARLTRAGMLEIVNQDYVRTARAKGLSETTIVVRHTLKGAVLPVVSYIGPAIAQLLTGSLVVEKIFGIPGLGTEFVQGALNRDYDVAMGLVLLFGTLLIVANLIVDVVYGFLDPRIRHA
ncbi:MAG: ABC transporter permease [Planctomycetota bacterium]